MSLKIVSAEFTDRQGMITVEAPTQEEAAHADAKRLVLQAAAQQLPRPGLSGLEAPYPVDENGETDDDLILGRRGKVAAYRCDYRVTGGL